MTSVTLGLLLNIPVFKMFWYSRCWGITNKIISTNQLQSCRVMVHSNSDLKLTPNKKQNAAYTCNSNGSKPYVTVLRGGMHRVFWDSLAARNRMTHCGLSDLLFVFLSFIPFLASLVNLNMQQDACLSFNSTSTAAHMKHNTRKEKLEM